MKYSNKEKPYEKYAWVIFLFIGCLISLGGLPHVLGLNTDPALVEMISGETIQSLKASNPGHFNLYDFYFRSGGLSDLGVAFFLIVISIFAYRKGEKWSWYALCFVPVFFITFILLVLPLPVSTRSIMLPPLMIFTGISLAGLLLPFRRFFPSTK